MRRFITPADMVLSITIVVLSAIFLLPCQQAMAEQSWTSLDGTVGQYEITTMAYDQVHDILYAGVAHAGQAVYGVWRCSNPRTTPTWASTEGGISSLQVTTLAYDGTHDVLYAGAANGMWRCSNPRTSPASWTNVGGVVANGQVLSLAYDAAHDVVYAGTTNLLTGQYVYRCNNPRTAPTWSGFGAGVTAQRILYDSTHDVLYTGAFTNGVYRFDNPSTAPTSHAMGGGLSSYAITGLACDEVHDIIYACGYSYGNPSLESAWRCAGPRTAPAWTDIGAIGIRIKALAYSGASDVLYMGSDNGVGRCDNPRTVPSWTSTGGDVSGDNIDALTWDATHGVLYAGTYYDGAWRYGNVVASVLYLAEGSTNWGFSCYISIENPNDQAVPVSLTYNTTDRGAVQGPSITMPTKSQATVNPADTLGASDFSTQVTCLTGQSIEADRTMTWNRTGQEEGHCSVAVPGPSKTWYLAEGSSAWEFECWLLIQNPDQQRTANCQVTYMIEGEGPRTINKTVGPSSRASFDISKDIGSKDASIKVASDVPVIPERAMYRNNRREGHDSIGTTSPASDYYLAEGATGYNVGYITYVLVQNPQNSPTDVSITYMTGAGRVTGPSFQMPANSRKTIRVNDQLPAYTDVSTKVHGSQPIIAERAMYWNNGTGEACHDSIGMASPHNFFYLPDGQTSGGRETWTLVQNPNGAEVAVEISYLTGDGQGNVIKVETIPGGSRKTFNMASHSGISGRAAIMVRSLSGGPVMVERSMYWNNRGAGTDTIGGYSD